MVHPGRRHNDRMQPFTWLAALLALVVSALTLTTANPTTASAAPPDESAAPIQPDLTEKLEAKGETAFWVRFEAEANLSTASRVKSWSARGAAVASSLKQTATDSQTGVRAELDEANVDYKAFWATNAIYVPNGTKQLAEQLSTRPEVEGLYAPVRYEVPELMQGDDVPSINSVEWGIDNINANDVWDQYGVDGDGITVATIDTGVEFDHPALVNQYRGNNGDGTFEHNYNWFDAAGACDGAPCDLEGHGTHTMGTIAGDDGAGNQVGVAPGVKWIEANGCCPSDTALMESGQWLLEPTDLNGENPDASMRPNIISNSWGTTSPSNDPFMEDVTEAWAASGIFGVWSNGNNGPSCETSGSPGSRTVNYSVGAYSQDNTIADFSSRGPGQGGETKPNISAPGVNVRSSVPGGGYESYDGTSMASPHVAGSIALLWSAAPALIGDVETTKTLLDDTSVDMPDDSCGGTNDDNNVWGEGRLDALALLNNAPIGDTGTLAGTVTDAETGEPLAGATLTITGEVDREITTDENGAYSLLLLAGNYEVTVSTFGYGEETANVAVKKDETTTKDFPLEAVPSVNVSGTVTDGSGHGWPVYSRVSVVGVDDVFTYTTPSDGHYQLSLPSNGSYELEIDPQYPGYTTLTKAIEVGDSDMVQDVSVKADPADCSGAPGYTFGSDGVFEPFDAAQAPEGWTVEDNVGNDQVWAFDDPGGRGNNTGGTGGFGIIDSDFYGSGGEQDTSLVSPVVDLTDVAKPVIRFQQDFDAFGEEIADVDLSVNGGQTWKNVLKQQGTSVDGQRQIQIPQAAGKQAVQVRFHYHKASYAWWWAVDDVLIGSKVTCEPTEGGLVVGHVRDANDDAPVNGASVTSKDEPAETTTTMATPDDPNLPDGFFWMFSSLTGTHPFEGAASSYQPQMQDVDVQSNWVAPVDFQLAAGRLEVEGGPIDVTAPMGGTAESTLTVTNTGTAPAELEVTERSGSFEILRADGTTLSEDQIAASAGAPVRRIPGEYSPLSHAGSGQASDADGNGRAGDGKGADARRPQRAGPTAEPWTDISEYPTAIMDSAVDVLDGKVYSIGGFDGGEITAASYMYDQAAQTWSPIADLPEGRENPVGGFIDGLFYVNGGWGVDGTPLASTMVYDPASDSWSEAAEAPVAAAAAGKAILDGQLYLVGGCQDACGLTDVRRYDPGSDSWEALAEYPEPTAHVACGGLEGQVFCAGGSADAASTHTYAYDPGSDTWTQKADLPIDLWGMGYAAANGQLLVSGGVTDQFATVTNEGFAYDPAADTWSELPASNNTVYRGGSSCGLYRIGGDTGGFFPMPASEVLPGYDECASSADVPWLSVAPATATLAPGESTTVTVSMNADVTQPGAYTGGVGFSENTPYSTEPVDVTMNVQPPATWGKLTGTVTSVACDGGTAPLPGAVIQVDSWAMEITLIAEADGTYAHWLDRRNNPLTMIVAKDGWKPQTRDVRVQAGKVITEDFALKEIC